MPFHFVLLIVTGQDRPGQARIGQDRPGQARPGQDRTGQDRPGQARPGQENSEQQIRILLLKKRNFNQIQTPLSIVAYYAFDSLRKEFVCLKKEVWSKLTLREQRAQRSSKRNR